MWRCARCGARNSREAGHCGQCGMPSPFDDGGHTKTIDVPPITTEPSREEPSSPLPWVIIGVVTVLLLVLLVVAVVALAS
jgi:uncharacterized membrane protein YvbJ